MERFAFVMLFDALIDVFGKANIIALGMRYGANDVNVEHAVRRTMTDSLRLHRTVNRERRQHWSGEIDELMNPDTAPRRYDS